MPIVQDTDNPLFEQRYIEVQHQPHRKAAESQVRQQLTAVNLQNLRHRLHLQDDELLHDKIQSKPYFSRMPL